MRLDTGTAGVSPAGASRYRRVRPQVLLRLRAAGETPAVPVKSASDILRSDLVK